MPDKNRNDQRPDEGQEDTEGKSILVEDQASFIDEGPRAGKQFGDGRKVANLASGFQSAGAHEAAWNGRSIDGARVKAGVYFVRGTLGTKAISSRLLVLQ